LFRDAIFTERDYVTFGYLLQQIRLSSVCNVPASYSAGSNIPQYSYATLYSSHPLTSLQNFTEIVTGTPPSGVKR